MSMKDNPIPQHILERGHRCLARRIASALVTCMAETDITFEQIGLGLGQPEAEVRKWLYDMIEGKTSEKTLNQMSDFALAMACELRPSVQPLNWQFEDQIEEVAATA